MSLRIKFVILRVACRFVDKNNPSTMYFVVTLKNNISTVFEQQFNCKITLSDIVESDSISSELKNSAKIFSEMNEQKNNNWLNEMIDFRNKMVAVLKSNIKAYVTLLPPILN